MIYFCLQNFFNPINRNGGGQNNGSYSPIELQVTNLDQNIDPKDMKRILHSIFMEHVMVQKQNSKKSIILIYQKIYKLYLQ